MANAYGRHASQQPQSGNPQEFKSMLPLILIPGCQKRRNYPVMFLGSNSRYYSVDLSSFRLIEAVYVDANGKRLRTKPPESIPAVSGRVYYEISVSDLNSLIELQNRIYTQRMSTLFSR